MDILYNLFIKIYLIWWDKFSCNFKYIFINEIGFIKKIVLIVGQSRVLQDGAGLRRAPRVGDGVRKFSPSCGAGRGWGTTIPCDLRMKTPSFDPIFWPRPAPLPSLPGSIYQISTDAIPLSGRKFQPLIKKVKKKKWKEVKFPHKIFIYGFSLKIKFKNIFMVFK